MYAKLKQKNPMDYCRLYCLARLGTNKARIAFERALELQNDNSGAGESGCLGPSCQPLLLQRRNEQG
ncbi:unnamed protein product [Cylicocyclus nassatus]|uniref:Uncharacterized protein n=1 Tax=Cylicocyclus nassatus TaxID=53992 RepID=A0AA36GN56_CYLNA|nr:unnamed protein product [Cylicocyclus nassatus]